MKIYLQQDGANAGPFDEATVRQRLQAGSLTPEVYAWREGMKDWQPLGELLASVPFIPRVATAAPDLVANPTAPMPGQSSRMPWWAKLLLGCGGLLALAVVVAAACVVFVIYKSEHPAARPSATQYAGRDKYDDTTAKDREDDAKLDKEIAADEAKLKKEQTDIQAEIDRDDADPAHYTVTKQIGTDGSSTVTVTPKEGASGKPITKQVDADGKVTTTTVDANGDTVTKSIDTHGNISTVTTPKAH